MNVRVTHKRARTTASKPDVPHSSRTFIDWFWEIDCGRGYCRRFSRLSEAVQERILVGIRFYVRMCEKNQMMSIDPSPIREIIADAESGLFYFEQVMADRLIAKVTEDRNYAAHYAAMEMAGVGDL